MTCTIVPAATHSMASLAELFTRGYTGYFTPIALTEDTFTAFARAHDLDLDASRVVAADSGPAAFAMLAIRGDRGWIGGMGVVPEARGHGLGQLAMTAVLDAARLRGLRRVDLEVLDENLHASRIYERLGFHDVRRLDSWGLPATPAPADASAQEPPVSVPREASDVTRLSVEGCLANVPSAADEPAWQRDVRAHPTARGPLEAIGIGGAAGPQAWIVFRVTPAGVQLYDVGLVPGAPERAFDGLIAHLIETNPGAAIGVLNLPSEHPAARSLERAGFTRRWRQREMRWEP